MPFSEEAVRQAWERSGGNCECRRTTHGHGQRCNQSLVRDQRGMTDSPGSWDTHHRLSPRHGGADSAANCEVLCSSCRTSILVKAKRLFGAD